MKALEVCARSRRVASAGSGVSPLGLVALSQRSNRFISAATDEVDLGFVEPAGEELHRFGVFP
jgi:hypothetical protein